MSSALIAVFGLIALGHLLRRSGFVPLPFWLGAERFTYFLALPALLVARLAEAPLGELALVPMATLLIGGVLGAAGLLIGLRPRLAANGPGLTSALQGAFRPNTYVGLATAGALYGTEGVMLAAVSLGILVPLVNLVAIAALLYYAPSSDGRRPGFVASVVRNPLVLACAVGLSVAALPLTLPPPASAFLDAVGQAALPLGLMAAGAGLSWGALGRSPRLLAASTAIKLLLLPMGVGVAALTWGLPTTTGAVLVLFAGVPASASCYILARQLGGDAPLMASILTVQTAAAVLTLPLVLGIYTALADRALSGY